MSDQPNRDQVDTNYEAFRRELPKLIQTHANKYALIRDGEIITCYTTLEDAYATATRFYPDGRFSVQKITDEPVDLGFFSHALHIG